LNKISKPYEDDEFYKRWFVGLANRTKENYRNQFGVWQDFIKMTPTEQVNKRMNDLTTTNLNQRQFFENKFREFKEYLEQRGNLKALAVRTLLTPVASFFSRNGLSLNLKRGDWASTLPQQVIQKFKLTKKDIKQMYAHGNLRPQFTVSVVSEWTLVKLTLQTCMLKISQNYTLYLKDSTCILRSHEKKLVRYKRLA
jgi:hypothetical protein